MNCFDFLTMRTFINRDQEKNTSKFIYIYDRTITLNKIEKFSRLDVKIIKFSIAVTNSTEFLVDEIMRKNFFFLL